MFCKFDGCKNDATHSVTLNIPMEGVPIDLHRPIKMYVDIQLCLEHSKSYGKDFSWEDNLLMQDSINESLRALSSTKADYDRTFHSIVKLTDSGYLQFREFLKGRTPT